MSLSFSLQVSFSLCLFVSLLLYPSLCSSSPSFSQQRFALPELPQASHSSRSPWPHPARSPHRLFKIVSPKPPQAIQDRLTKATASPESWIWVGRFFKIRSRLWVLNWFYGRGYVLIEGFGLWVWVDWFGSWLLWVVPWVEAVWWVDSFFFFFLMLLSAMVRGEKLKPWRWEKLLDRVEKDGDTVAERDRRRVRNNKNL